MWKSKYKRNRYFPNNVGDMLNPLVPIPFPLSPNFPPVKNWEFSIGNENLKTKNEILKRNNKL